MPEEEMAQFARELGRLTWNFSQLEHQLQWFVAYLAGGSEEAWILASSLSFKRLIQTGIAIAHTSLRHETAFIEEFTQVTRLMNQAEARRNIVVHSSWLVSIEDTGDITRSKTKLRKEFLERQMEPMPLTKLREISDLVAQALDSLRNLIPRHQGALEWPYGPGKTAQRILVDQYRNMMSIIRDGNLLLASLGRLRSMPREWREHDRFMETLESHFWDNVDHLADSIHRLEAEALEGKGYFPRRS
jgi:hypothetical protein